MTRDERIKLARRRIINILTQRIILTRRSLENKISDAGPYGQRIDPHLLAGALHSLLQERRVLKRGEESLPWFYLPESPATLISQKYNLQSEVYLTIHNADFIARIGQALEIAIYKALQSQTSLPFLGGFPDLAQHPDDRLYRKTEPPSLVSGRQIPGGRNLDFLVLHPTAGTGAIEAKNIRNWLYYGATEIKELLQKALALDAVPILIARRIQYSTFSMLHPCGLVVHQTYNQLYPASGAEIAALARDKSILGFHDIRVGNEPDKRLTKFISQDLPRLMPSARARFDEFKDLLDDFSFDRLSRTAFAYKVRARQKGFSEDYPPADADTLPDPYDDY